MNKRVFETRLWTFSLVVIVSHVVGYEFFVTQVWLSGTGIIWYFLGLVLSWLMLVGHSIAVASPEPGSQITRSRVVSGIVLVAAFAQALLASVVLHRGLDVLWGQSRLGLAAVVMVIAALWALEQLQPRRVLEATIVVVAVSLLMFVLLLALPAVISVDGWNPQQSAVNPHPDGWGIASRLSMFPTLLLGMPMFWDATARSGQGSKVLQWQRTLLFITAIALLVGPVVTVAVGATAWFDPRSALDAAAVWPRLLEASMDPLIAQVGLGLQAMLALVVAAWLLQHSSEVVSARMALSFGVRHVATVLLIALALVAPLVTQQLQALLPAVNAWVAVVVLPVVLGMRAGMGWKAIAVMSLLCAVFFGTAVADQSPGDPAMWSLAVALVAVLGVKAVDGINVVRGKRGSL